MGSTKFSTPPLDARFLEECVPNSLTWMIVFLNIDIRLRHFTSEVRLNQTNQAAKHREPTKQNTTHDTAGHKVLDIFGIVQIDLSDQKIQAKCLNSGEISIRFLSLTGCRTATRTLFSSPMCRASGYASSIDCQ